jgi:hypothetical protein
MLQTISTTMFLAEAAQAGSVLSRHNPVTDGSRIAFAGRRAR